MAPSSSFGLLFEAQAPMTGYPLYGTPYVPMLLDRRGERRALADLQADAWASMTPLVQIVPPPLRDTAEQGTPPELWVAALAHVVAGRAIYLDPAGVQRRSRTMKPLGESAVASILAAATGSGMR
jgi:hypothetical protein